jgi:ABC-2 type transport system permease protein
VTGPTERAVARHAFGRVRTGAVVWGLVFGGTIASSALSYARAYPDAASRHQAAVATSRSRGLAVVLGPISEIESVGGYTVYKCFVFVTTIGAIWALLATTRLLRGEEDAGRWQLQLAGGTRPARATAAVLGAMGAAVAVVFAGTTACTLAAARDPDLAFGTGRTLLYGVSTVVPAAVFVGVGALTSQLGRTRRMASGLGMAIFGLCFVARMAADSGLRTRWLLWVTPFGWTERMRPLTQPDGRPLVPAVLTTLVLAGAAVVLAGRRDCGSGVVATRDQVPLRPFGLGSASGLVARREIPVLVAWAVGAGLGAFAFGTIAQVADDALPSGNDTLERFGVSGTFVHQYFGVAFLLMATIVSLLPAGPFAAAAEDEAAGRTALVAALPVRRYRLAAGRLGLVAVAVVVVGALTGVASWLGARVGGVDPGLGATVGAGLNVVPTGLLVLGLGAVVAAVAPRAAGATVYGVVVGSLVIDLVSSLVEGTRPLERLSLFHYMALAPAQGVDPTAVTVTLALAAGLGLLGVGLSTRRDLRS